MFALFPKFGAKTRPQDLRPFLISETGLNFLIRTQGEIDPGNRASPVNRTHMKRPLEPAGRIGDFGNFLNGFAKNPHVL